MAPSLVTIALSVVGLSSAEHLCSGAACAADEDETTLLALRASHTKVAKSSANTSGCKGYPASLKSHVPTSAGEGNPKTLGWWNMPEQDLSFTKNLKPFTELPAWGRNFTKYATFSLVDADEGARLMYNATKLKKKDGGGQVPKELGGVWWMKGNAIAEELTVLQYGKWYPDDGVYVAAYAPMVWSWPAGKPKNPPGGGIMYSHGASRGATNSVYLSIAGTAISYAMSTCSQYATCSKWGNPLGNMSFGNMQLHPGGKLQSSSNIGDLAKQQVPIWPGGVTASGAFTIEAKKDFSASNRVWRRKCMFGINSPGCAKMNFGSYDLTQVIDGDGKETQSFQEWVNYMGKVQMIVWSGFKDEASKKQLAKRYQ